LRMVGFFLLLVAAVDVLDGGLVLDLAEVVDHVAVLVADTIAFEVGIGQLVIVVRRGLLLVVHLGLLDVEEAEKEIAEEQQGQIENGGQHVLRLPEINLVCDAHSPWCWMGSTLGLSSPFAAHARDGG